MGNDQGKPYPTLANLSRQNETLGEALLDGLMLLSLCTM
jgi:hypothetical protein